MDNLYGLLTNTIQTFSSVLKTSPFMIIVRLCDVQVLEMVWSHGRWHHTSARSTQLKCLPQWFGDSTVWDTGLSMTSCCRLIITLTSKVILVIVWMFSKSMQIKCVAIIHGTQNCWSHVFCVTPVAATPNHMFASGSPLNWAFFPCPFFRDGGTEFQHTSSNVLHEFWFRTRWTAAYSNSNMATYQIQIRELEHHDATQELHLIWKSSKDCSVPNSKL